MRLENKTVILTGASSGVGHAAALLFAREGATVYAVARRAERLDALAKEAEANGSAGKILAAPGSVTDQASIDALVARVMDEQGRLDIVVNNAGLLDDFEPVGDVSDDLWQQVFDVNVTGPMRLMRAALGVMKEGGSLVNTGSIAGIVGGKAGCAYTASKHALVGLVKNTAAMYANRGIRCNIVLPGGIATEMVQGMETKSQYGLSIIGGTAQLVSRMAQPEEIASILLFLASDEAININGSLVVADGGLTSF